MPDSSILGGDRPQQRATGLDNDLLGPSDSSDTGSDVQGERPMATGPDAADELGAVPVDLEGDSDSTGTGERGSATGDVMDAADILPDRIDRDPTLAGDFAEAPDETDVLDPDELAAGDSLEDEDDAAS